mmetsp:Transcript_37855/g.94892  ORF Transcript_37855/g.94892 Transcript_37855/m.94892 type:complete len:474 (-) Transcript_37855:51-1472(-)
MHGQDPGTMVGEDVSEDRLVDPAGFDESDGAEGAFGLGMMEAVDPQDTFYHPPITNQDELAVWLAIAEVQAKAERRHRELDMRMVVASKTGNESLARRVYPEGADVCARDGDGTPALYWAATRGHLRMVMWLLRNGADPNARRKQDGRTPLMAAAARGDLAVMRVLCEYGARGDFVDKGAESAFSEAERRRHRAASAAMDRWFGSRLRENVERRLVLKKAMKMAEKDRDGAASTSLRLQLSLALRDAPKQATALAFHEAAVAVGTQDTMRIEDTEGDDAGRSKGGVWAYATDETKRAMVDSRHCEGALVPRRPNPDKRPPVYVRPKRLPRHSELDPAVLKRRRKEEVRLIRKKAGLDRPANDFLKRAKPLGGSGITLDEVRSIDYSDTVAVTASGLRTMALPETKAEEYGAEDGAEGMEESRQGTVEREESNMEKPEVREVKKQELRDSIEKARGDGDVHLVAALTKRLKCMR